MFQWWYYIAMYNDRHDVDYVEGERCPDGGIPVGCNFSVAVRFEDVNALHAFAHKNGIAPADYCVRGFYEKMTA